MGICLIDSEISASLETAGLKTEFIPRRVALHHFSGLRLTHMDRICTRSYILVITRRWRIVKDRFQIIKSVALNIHIVGDVFLGLFSQQNCCVAQHTSCYVVLVQEKKKFIIIFPLNILTSVGVWSMWLFKPHCDNQRKPILQ